MVIAEREKQKFSEIGQLIFDSSPYIVYVMKLDGTVVDCNKKAEEWLGYDRSEIVGKNYLKLSEVLTENLPEITERYKRISQEESPEPFDTQVHKNDGSVAWINSYISFFQLENEKYFLAILKDITDRKIAEQKLQESKEQYQRAYEHETFYKDLFTHDINNILQSVLTSLEIIKLQLESGEEPSNMKPILEIINEQISRGTSLVNNVDKFSQLGETKKNLVDVDVEKTLKEAIKYTKKNFKNKQINIQFASPKNEIYIQADDLLKDIFENILINAVKHNNNPNIEIIIKTSKLQQNGKSYWQIEFIDNGMGIPEPKRKSIFSRGFKEDRSVSGMGLGLSLVKTIIDRFNAKILVESRVPEDYLQGTNFKLLFPEVE
ncbi:MAG: PAS domain S-box protein [Promethearchaeota archaeon]|jgi:PAS domain S-box-containing protein